MATVTALASALVAASGAIAFTTPPSFKSPSDDLSLNYDLDASVSTQDGAQVFWGDAVEPSTGSIYRRTYFLELEDQNTWSGRFVEIGQGESCEGTALLRNVYQGAPELQVKYAAQKRGQFCSVSGQSFNTSLVRLATPIR